MNGLIGTAFAALACLGFTATSYDAESTQSIDNVIADAAYNKVMPVGDLDYAAYHERITDRLEYLEDLLRSRDVRAWPRGLRTERMKNIERLHAYRLQGKFPINYDHPEKQLPCFFDRDGNLCAVANLIAQSAGMNLVRRINDRYQYATVSEMQMPEIDAWIARSGLTREEVITIQEPGFTGRGYEWQQGLLPNEDISTINSYNVVPAPPVDSLGLQLQRSADTTAPGHIEKKQDTFPDLSQTVPSNID